MNNSTRTVSGHCATSHATAGYRIVVHKHLDHGIPPLTSSRWAGGDRASTPDGSALPRWVLSSTKEAASTVWLHFPSSTVRPFEGIRSRIDDNLFRVDFVGTKSPARLLRFCWPGRGVNGVKHYAAVKDTASGYGRVSGDCSMRQSTTDEHRSGGYRAACRPSSTAYSAVAPPGRGGTALSYLASDALLGAQPGPSIDRRPFGGAPPHVKTIRLSWR